MSASRTVFVLALISTACALSAPVLAEDAAVTQRLQAHGGLPSASAKRLVAKLSQRMAKSADTLAQANDPLRVAVSQALFHAPVPPDAMAAAKMRLRLYAGLNEWALTALFTPKPGAIAACARDTGATTSECEALVAAAGNNSVAEARTVAGGPPMATSPALAPRNQNAVATGPAPARFGGGRFGSGAPAQSPTYASAQPQRAAYAPAPAPVARTSYGAQPAGRPAPAMNAQAQKESYKAQREAYLARQKAQFEERKQKLETAAASTPAPDVAAPSGGQKATPVAAATSKSAPSSKAEPAAAAEPAAEEAPAEDAPAPAAKGGKPALDNDFLDGLLADPLGGKKK